MFPNDYAESYDPTDADAMFIIIQMSEVYKRKVYFCGQDCIESFRTTRLNSDFKKLPIENFYSAAAPNSGPLALLYRKYAVKQLKLPENYDNRVLFFNCKGDPLRQMPFELKERVILFEFLPDQQLLIVYANANYFILDPATGTSIKQGSLLSEEETKSNAKNRCLGAQLVGHRIVLLKERVLGVVERVGSETEGQWKGYPAMKFHLDNPVFGCSLTPEGDLQVFYLSESKTIDIFSPRKWQESSSPPITIYSNPVLKANAINLVSICKQGDRLGLIFTDRAILARVDSGSLVFPYNEFNVNKEDPVAKSQTKSKYRNFYKIGFIQSTLYFFDRVRLMLLSLNEPRCQLRHLSLTSLLAEASVGFRLLDEHTFIFRPIRSPLYFALLDKQDLIEKFLKAAPQQKQQQEQLERLQKLLGMYQSFVDHKPIEMNRVRQMEGWVAEVWETVMQLAGQYVDPGEQLMALRFSNFLLTYFRFESRNSAMEALSKELRVVNGLRHESLNRWLTYQEFLSLKSGDYFLPLLLRYRMHFVADMIYEDSKSKERIFTHWARCKIQKETEETALEEIRGRYQQMKVAIGPTYVFTDLARHCLSRTEKNLTKLAMQLIELEPHPARRAIVFLFIFLARKEPQSVDKLLQEAERSLSPQTIHITLQSLRKVSQDWLPPKAWLELLPRRPLLEYHYLRLLRANGELEELKEYLTLNGLFVEMSYMSLSKELAKLESPSLDNAVQIVSKDYSKILSSLSDNLMKCTPRPGVQLLRELRDKKYPITEEDASGLNQDGELEVLAEIIIQKDSNLPLAARILRKIKSDRVYALLLRKGKVKDAIEQAFARKNKQQLLQLIPLVDESIQPLAKQLYEQLQQKR